ncbi:MAG: DUF1405 domain-containing protein [Roseiflexaceae bacterium]|jgi:uncharacterized membrane protein YpjA
MTQIWQLASDTARRLLQFIMDVPLIFWACMLGDLLGFLIGTVIWYGPQLMRAPWWAWPFIPDCPLAALLGLFAYMRLRAHQPADWLTVLASLSCIKYGIWTVIFWTTKWANTGEYLPLEIGLVIVHLALMAQGLLLLPALLQVTIPVRLIGVAWLALSVVVDYGFGHHPVLDPSLTRFQAGTWAAVITLMLGILMLLLARQSTSPAASTT